MEREHLPFSTYKDTVDASLLSEEAKRLVEAEKSIPVKIGIDQSLRIKVIDLCGHGCTFCHNEGTLVNENQANYRTSIFLENQKDLLDFKGFQAEIIEPDEEFLGELELAKAHLNVAEIHMTGGEPTQHPKLVQLVELMSKNGLSVKMTSNGESGGRIYKDLARAGLKGVNFSIFGSTPKEYSETQPPGFGLNWAKRKLLLSQEAIESAKAKGIDTKANCVMRNAEDKDRIVRLLNRANEEGFDLRVLNDLSSGQESVSSIYNLMADLKATPSQIHLLAGVSSTISYFELPNGQKVGFKQIRNLRLNLACDNCFIDEVGRCEEGYYGLRLYRRRIDGDEYVMGVCIQRMDLAMTTRDFYKSAYPDEVNKLKKDEWENMQSIFTYSTTVPDSINA